MGVELSLGSLDEERRARKPSSTLSYLEPLGAILLPSFVISAAKDDALYLYKTKQKIFLPLVNIFTSLIPLIWLHVLFSRLAYKPETTTYLGGKKRKGFEEKVSFQTHRRQRKDASYTCSSVKKPRD